MTAQIEMWIKLIKNRLDMIAESDVRPDIELQADKCFEEVEKLEQLLKEVK